MSDHTSPEVGPENTNEPEERAAPRATYSRRQQLRATRLEVGGVIGNTFTIWFGNLLPFSAMALLIYLPIMVVTHLFMASGPTPEGFGYFIFVRTVAERIFFSSLLTGTVTFGVIMQLRGQRAQLGRCLSTGLSRLFHVFAVTFMIAVLGILCFVPATLLALAGAGGLSVLLALAAIIPLFMIVIMYHVAIPVVVVERVSVGLALARSGILTKGSRWTIFGILFIFVLLIAAISWVFQFIVGAVAANLSMANAILVQTVFNVLLSPLWAIIPSVIYHDLRVGKEGVDVKDLAAVFE